jgi:hypothetical protein
MAEGDPVATKPGSDGVDMLEGNPLEPTGPEDAAGLGPKRGDYGDRNPDVQPHSVYMRVSELRAQGFGPTTEPAVADELDATDVIAVDQKALIAADPANVPEGTKGGVNSAQPAPEVPE